MKVKGNAGEHLTVLPPYGYMKSSDDKKQWVKDEEAAQVVYEIGLYIMDGLGPSQIARKLTERKILTPAAYYASKGRTTNVTKKGSPYAWDSSTIADIMDRWREYLGHTVNFKTRKNPTRVKRPCTIQKANGRFLIIPTKPSGRRRLPMQQGSQGRRGADPQRWEKWVCSPA